MSDSDRLQRYAELIVRVGANVQPGQTVFVGAALEHAELVRAVVRASYGAGARLVDVQYADAHVRKATLDALGLDAVRFRGPGTDLTIGIHADARWIGGALTTEGGIEHVPNVPTEEVFTLPERGRAEGTVRSTRPLALQGTVVRDLEL